MTSKPDFAANLTALETVIKEMESGGLTLEQMLEHYARGVELLKECKTQLQQAEGQVEILTNSLLDTAAKSVGDEE